MGTVGIVGTINAVLADYTERASDDIQPGLLLTEDLGMDSLDRQDLALQIEDKLGISIHVTAAAGWVTVQDIQETAQKAEWD